MNIFQNNDLEEDDELPYHWLEGDSLAPPCQTDSETITALLELIKPFASPESILYDLGCGDGRICIKATERYECKSIGVEIEPPLVEKFQKKIETSELLKAKVTAKNDSLLEVPFEEDATIIVLYLLPEAIELIRDKLIRCLERNAVVVCNNWGIKGVQPTNIIHCGFANNVKLFLYTKSSL